MRALIKRLVNWQVFLGVLLVSLSALVYIIHYLIFRDAHHIFIYLVGDVAFVFIEVLLVTLIIHRLLHCRERQVMLKKMNMVIGTFFLEVGTELLERFSEFDPDGGDIAQRLLLNNQLSDRDFARIRKAIKKHACVIDVKRGDLAGLKTLLVGQRPFLLDLLRNPNLLEHESFTDLLWAVFHLTEELHYRKDLRLLPEADGQHLDQDAQRAYRRLVVQWIDYMQHLKKTYPYLFSLAMRTNPFDRNASVLIKS